jgi:hypothetical protein
VCLWNAVEAKGIPRKREDSEDWLGTSINDPGGNLAQFFVRMLWELRKESGSDWSGLNGDVRDYMDRVISGASWFCEMGRVILATHVETLFQCDPAWTKENVVVLFCWQADPKQAVQAWHGYLTWGNQSDELLEILLPFCTETFPRIEDLGDRAQQFCELMATVALYSAINPMTSGWLPKFILDATAKYRVAWASAVRVFLGGFPNGRRGRIWEGWMKNYWEFRLSAASPLDPGEITQMASWSVELEDAFPEAVALILKGAAADEAELPCRSLQTSAIWRMYPAASALLVRFLVESLTTHPWSECFYELVQELAPLGAESGVLFDVCQRLAVVGDARRAEELERYVRSYLP